MKNFKVLTTIFFLLTIFGCEKDAPDQPGADVLYTPYLTSIRDNGKVTLKWGKPMCAGCGGCFCPQLDPDYFEILMSDTDPSKLKTYSIVTKNSFELPITDLTNGRPYYFAIKAMRQKKFAMSKTIMVIPENPENFQTLFQTINKDSEDGTWSPDQSSVGYVSNFTWNNGKNSSKSVFIYSFSNNKEWLVEKNARSPEWSPTGQKIVYHTDNGEINSGQGFATHISVFIPADSTTKRLTSGNSFNFLPTWSPDGNWIAFLSNMAGGNEYNIWKIPAGGGTAIQLSSDFNDLNGLEMIHDLSPQALSWSKDGNSIAFARLTKSNPGFNTDIYTIPANGGSRSILISSQWDEYAPVYSPDGTTIAFVSNRSGANEIWTMNLQTKKLRQITGSKEKWVYANPGKIEWSATGNKILFTSHSDNHWTLFTVDAN